MTGSAMPASGLTHIEQDLSFVQGSPAMMAGDGRCEDSCVKAGVESWGALDGFVGVVKQRRPDAERSMILLRERAESLAERLARQVGVLNAAKMEAFGCVEDLEPLDASSFEETVHGRLGLVSYQLDRLENVIADFGTTA